MNIPRLVFIECIQDVVGGAFRTQEFGDPHHILADPDCRLNPLALYRQSELAIELRQSG